MNSNQNNNRGKGGGNKRNMTAIVSILLWALVLTLLVNLATSRLQQANSVEVSYGQFRQLIMQDAVESVVMSSGKYTFTLKEGYSLSVGEDGEVTVRTPEEGGQDSQAAQTPQESGTTGGVLDLPLLDGTAPQQQPVQSQNQAQSAGGRESLVYFCAPITQASIRDDDLVSLLEEHGAVATFFEVARNLPEAPEAVRRAADMGCEIGSHSYRHANLGKMDQAAQQADQAAADALFQEVLGTTPALLRPPYGSMNKTLKTTSGRSIVTWSIDTEDWRSKDADKVVTGVENAGNLDGQVILLHSIYESTVEAVRILIPWLIEQGYQLVTVSELIQLRFGDEVEPNRTYNYDYFRFQVPPLPAETAPAAA